MTNDVVLTDDQVQALGRELATGPNPLTLADLTVDERSRLERYAELRQLQRSVFEETERLGREHVELTRNMDDLTRRRVRLENHLGRLRTLGDALGTALESSTTEVLLRAIVADEVTEDVAPTARS